MVPKALVISCLVTGCVEIVVVLIHDGSVPLDSYKKHRLIQKLWPFPWVCCSVPV